MLSDTMMLGGGRKAAYPIENSLLFRGSQYLTRTPAVKGDRKTFTFHAWVRRSDITVMTPLVGYYNSGPKYWRVDFEENGSIGVVSTASSGGALVVEAYTTTVFRDPTAWYCVDVAIDTTEPIEADRVKVRVNGVEQPLSFTVAPEENQLCFFGDVGDVHIGEFNGHYAAAQFAEPILVDGAALSPDHFGQVDPVTGSWRPKAVSGVDFGPNGFYLGKPWDATDLGNDVSGRGNDWTPVGFAASDVVGDSPTNVACVLNPLASPFISSTTASFADGNLVLTNGTGVGYAVAIGTLAIPNSGKWVFRVDKPVTPSGGGLTLANTYWFAGVVAISQVGRRPGVEGLMWTAETGYAGVSDNGCVCNFGTAVTGKPAVNVSATYELMVDFDEGIITIKKDGDTYYSGVLANPGEWVLPIVYIYNAATTTVHFVDFTASAAGYKNICTANLPSTTGQTSGTFTGNANADGPCVFTGAVPETLSVNGNVVTWGTHADKLATGFKIRSASADYNASGANSWVATYDRKPTVGPKNRAPANAQGNP